MKTTITTKHFELTDSIATFVEEKFERLMKKVDNQTTIHVTLSTSKEGQKAEVLVYMNGKPLKLKLEAVDESLYVAIDKLVDKLIYQVNKRTDKKHERRHESIRFLKEQHEGDEEEIMEKKLVKRKQFDMKPMMEEEAQLQMELLGHSFFFFLNGETETMCLLYKRKDGHYGLIEGVR